MSEYGCMGIYNLHTCIYVQVLVSHTCIYNPSFCVSTIILHTRDQHTTQREQNMKRNAIMGPDHLLVRAL